MVIRCQLNRKIQQLLIWIVILFAFVFRAGAQQPFFTDDADVTEKGKLHFEFVSEFDRLLPSSLPIKYQNGTRATIAFGLLKNVEFNVSGQFLTLISKEHPRFVGGIGDTTFAVKYNFFKERENSRLPAFTVTGFVQAPTGDENRSLGSGIFDYGVNFIAQKTFRQKNILRINTGIIFSGNTLTGTLGISQVHGQIFTGNASYVRKINDRWQLGAEINVAETSKFEINRGQFQMQFGGNYQINEKTTFDFGVIAGRSVASPRLGLQAGISRDF